MNDLWPNDFKIDDIKAPVTLLREQASLLGQKTQNIVEAQVRSLETTGLSDSLEMTALEKKAADLRYGFYIVAPALGNYRYKLFTISHDFNLYPVTFHFDEDIGDEFRQNCEKPILGDSEAKFLNILGKALSSAKTKKVIRALLAESQAL